jgi:CrcB protein
MNALYIGLAGAAGSLSRYYMGLGVRRFGGDKLPWGTFAVNVLGSFIIGLVMAGFIARGELDSRLRLAITVGFLGGFTTYSSFAFETVTLIERKELSLAGLYIGGTLVLAAVACWGGIAAGRRLF